MPETLLRLHFLSLLLLCSCAFLSSSSTIDVDDVVVGLVACRSRQIEAFTQFTNEFDTRWCNHSDYSNGVWCNHSDNSTGAVTKIQLTACLSGTLKPNSSLFGFHQLRHLDLSNNNFISSTLPSKFGNLNRLENKLIGSFPLISNLTKLSVLSLSQNLFAGAIPSSIFTMPSLFYLNVNDNHLTGPHEVPDSSTSSSLEFLNLGKNQFEGKILEPISKLINLKRLDLSFLNISYPIDLRLLSSLKSLLDLYLSGNSLLATSLSADSDIPPNLETLVMSYCDLNEFPNILKTLNNLRSLSISSNRIKGKVPEWLWTLPRLSTVLLGNNYFNGFQGTRKVLVDSSVQMLDIQSNHFEGEIPLPPLSLNAFYARNNTFTGNIPLSFCNRISLTVLDLSYNNFTGPIPQCLNDFKEACHSASRRSAPRGGRGSSASSSRPSGSSHEQNSVPAPAPYVPAPYVPAPAAQEDPGVMSVQQLVQQPGREHLPVLHPNPRPGYTTWFDKSSNGISRSINNMMYSTLHTGYLKWCVIPREDRELWFRQFAVTLQFF
ncbi:hypothetical protein F2Q68_00024596 [Brassica cretica]|uniref:Leucine-rich repeat-containing N-terminal plant-type domain-containing protein n=1 Tax=Brassica cretica TaxID=69181 RepID=A0A8S9IDC9_BRACR|nr:hypothetical protein F2Q68_00024596 [Brassica cretica]